MRILNRPMFRYGGPIKEGVMHGMRNNYQSGQLVRPGPGRPGYKGLDWKKKVITKVPVLSNIYQKGITNIGKIWDKYKFPSKYSPKRKSYFDTLPFMERAGKYVRQHPIITGGGVVLGSQSEPAAWAAKTLAQAPVEVAQFATEALTPKKWEKYLPENEWWKWKSKSDWKPGDIRGEEGGDGGTGTGTGIGAGAQFKEDTAPIISDSMREKIRKDEQNKRLKGYLDMMGYDSAKKTAMSDALIDASALVQDASTEAGALKHADWGKLINKMIQTTSKRLDKPAQIREAVGLMATKAAIEKDMMESKGGGLKQNARDLVSAGVYKTEKEAMEHLAKKTDFEEIVGALAAKKEEVTGSTLADAWRIAGNNPPKAHVKGSDELYTDFKQKIEDLGGIADIELEFVKKEIPDRKAGEVYVIDDRLIIIQKDGSPKYRW